MTDKRTYCILRKTRDKIRIFEGQNREYKSSFEKNRRLVTEVYHRN
jgi:hypothetical protein